MPAAHPVAGGFVGPAIVYHRAFVDANNEHGQIEAEYAYHGCPERNISEGLAIERSTCDAGQHVIYQCGEADSACSNYCYVCVGQVSHHVPTVVGFLKPVGDSRKALYDALDCTQHEHSGCCIEEASPGRGLYLFR